MKRAASQTFRALCAMLLVLVATHASASGTRSIEHNQYDHFAQGELQSVALTSDGYLVPTWQRSTLGDSGCEIVWDAVRETSGSVLCATGHEGKLVRVIDEKTTRSLGRLPDAELTALARLGDGSTLIAGAPSGRIYRLGADDRLSTLTRLQATFVWRMAVDARGDVWAATGTPGRLFRLRPKGDSVEVEQVCELKSANLLDLWIDEAGTMGAPGSLYVGGQDPGWVYRVSPDGKQVNVLYNAQAEEVRALIPFGEGLALALNTERAPTPQAIQMTLRMAGAPVARERAGQPQAQPAAPSGGAEGGKALEEAFQQARGAQYGMPRSEIVLLGREGFARTLWTSPERPIHSVSVSPAGALLAAAGDRGRMFEIQKDGTHAVVADLREDYLVRIASDGDGYLLTAGRNGVVFTMANRRAGQAVYISPALDGQAPVTWGSFYLRGDINGSRRVTVAFRTGNDGDVESAFWSPWSDEIKVERDTAIPLPAGPARFLQYRLTLKPDSEPLRLDAAEAFYRQPNAAPLVRDLTVADMPDPRQAARQQSGGAPPAPAPMPAQPATVPGRPLGGAGVPVPTDAMRESRSNSMTIRVAWQASDPNGDALRYALHYKGEDESTWKLIDDELTQNNMVIDIGGVADGRYRFRVTATDFLANPAGEARVTELVSDQVVIDNTAPEFLSAETRRRDGGVVIELELTDPLSLLASLKADVDNGDAYPVSPVDGILDQRLERFEWRAPGDLEPGEHVVTFAATDRRGNSVVKKVVFNVDKK